jgi:hypothetical protein
MTEYFLNINKNDNIYIYIYIYHNCGCKMGRTWIHQHLWGWTASQNTRIDMAAVIHSRAGLRAQKFVADRSLMVQNTENDPDMP